MKPPSEKVTGGDLLVGRTKTLSFRQDRLPLSGIAEAAGETGRERGRENTAGLLFVANAKRLQSVLS